VFDQDRFNALAQGAANANPIGFVAIQVSDLRWLLGMVTESSMNRGSLPPVGGDGATTAGNFQVANPPNTESTDDSNAE
jgi:hypothetical protein